MYPVAAISLLCKQAVRMSTAGYGIVDVLLYCPDADPNDVRLCYWFYFLGVAYLGATCNIHRVSDNDENINLIPWLWWELPGAMPGHGFPLTVSVDRGRLLNPPTGCEWFSRVDEHI